MKFSREPRFPCPKKELQGGPGIWLALDHNLKSLKTFSSEKTVIVINATHRIALSSFFAYSLVDFEETKSLTEFKTEFIFSSRERERERESTEIREILWLFFIFLMDSGSDRLLYFRVVIIVVFLASLSVLFLGFYVFLFFSLFLCPRLHKGHVCVLGSISCDGTVQWRASPYLDVQAKLHDQ